VNNTEAGDQQSGSEADGDVVVSSLFKKRKRGKDLSCLLHRQALELDEREAAIESKAQGLVEEIKRQDSLNHNLLPTYGTISMSK
jgi:hypothetical protein